MQGQAQYRRSAPRAGRPGLVLLCSVLLSLLTGCGVLQKVGILKKAPEEPTRASAPLPLSEQPYSVELTLVASDQLNPDPQSRPSPVQVRVFLAEAQSEIGSSSFEELFDYAGNVMEPRPLAILLLRPGQTHNLSLPANKAQTLLVVAAAFHDPYQSLWKAAALISPQDIVRVEAGIDAASVTINPSP